MNKKEIRSLSKKYGTPLFVVDLDKIKDNFLRFRKAFPESILAYSYKTNYYPRIINLIDRLGGNPEVVSFMELEFAKKVSNLNKAILNGPAKTREEIEFAVKNNVFLINIDSVDEIELLESVARKLKKKVNVGLRFNPLVKIQGKTIFSSKDSKLGMKKPEILKAVKTIERSKYLNLNTIHTHLGTQITSPEGFILAIHEIKKIIDLGKIKLKYIDLGGGFSNETTLNEKGLSIKDFSSKILAEMKKLGLNQKLIFEPGRYIVDDACFFISQIKCLKENWAILDVGVNSLIPLKSSDYKIECLTESKEKRYNFAGNLCFDADVIARNVLCPKLKARDLVKISNCGAYTLSMSEQFIYPFPTVIVKENGVYKLDLKRKSPKEIFKFWSKHNFSRR